MLSSTLLRSLRSSPARPTPANLRIASSTVWSRSLAQHNKSNKHQKKTSDFSKYQAYPQPTKPAGVASANGARSNSNSGKPDLSEAQAELDRSAPPPRNTVSGNKATGSIPEGFRNGESSGTQSDPAVDPVETQNQPLPDLTRGIPSTLKYETAGSTRSTPFDLTESEEPPPSGAGGKGRGELPASAYVSSSEKKRDQFANYMYALFLALSVGGTVYLGRNWETESEESAHPNAPSGWALGPMWYRAKARLGDQLSYYHEPAFTKLLPDPDPIFERPYTLVLSLEDLLIHNEWSREHGWRMAKRPGVDYFLRYLSQYYELVIFTSQPWAIADPVVRKLDPFHIVTWPLFREATLYEKGEYVKDLSYLNRDLSKVIILDTVPAHVKKQSGNAIILDKWAGSVQDKELVSLIPFLEYIHTMAYPDVREVLKSFEGKHIPTEFARREAIARKKFQEQLQEESKKRPKHSGLGFLSNSLGIKSGGMMVMADGEQSPAEAFAQGKMMQDQARERGQRTYEALEKEIRENGEKWLKEEAAQEEKLKEEGMKAMKSGFTGWFGGNSDEGPK